MKGYLITYFILLASVLSALSQHPIVLPLDTVLLRVALRNPDLLRFESQAEAYRAKAEGSQAWMPPSVSVGLMRFPYNIGMAFEKDDPMNQAGIGIAVEQMLPAKAKQESRRAYLESFALTEDMRRVRILHFLRRKAKGYYHSRQVNELKLKSITEAGMILDLLIQLSEARFTHNQAGSQAVFKAKARRAEINNMQYMLEGMIRESNLALNALMVQDLDSEFAVDSVIAPKSHNVDAGENPLIANRSDLQAIDREIQTMQLEKVVMKAELRPELGLRAEHMTMFGMPSQWTIMAMASLPFAPWSAKMTHQELKAIDHEITSMQLEKESMLWMAENMVAEWRSMLRTAYLQYESYQKEILPAYEANLEANLMAYRQNDGDLFQLLDAWEMALMKRIEMLDQLYKILELEADYAFELEIE